MPNISNKEIIETLEETGKWMTFEQLIDSMTSEYECLKFHARLKQLVEQGKIQYFDGKGVERSYYGKLGLTLEDE